MIVMSSYYPAVSRAPNPFPPNAMRREQQTAARTAWPAASRCP
jgi:hypothetical protein